MKTTIRYKYAIILCLMIAGCSDGSTAPEEEETVYEFYYRVSVSDQYGIDPEIGEPAKVQVTWRDENDQAHDNFDDPVTSQWESPTYEGLVGQKATMTITELTDYRKTVTAQIVVDGQTVAEQQKEMNETRTQGLTLEYEMGQNNP